MEIEGDLVVQIKNCILDLYVLHGGEYASVSIDYVVGKSYLVWELVSGETLDMELALDLIPRLNGFNVPVGHDRVLSIIKLLYKEFHEPEVVVATFELVDPAFELLIHLNFIMEGGEVLDLFLFLLTQPLAHIFDEFIINVSHLDVLPHVLFAVYKGFFVLDVVEVNTHLNIFSFLVNGLVNKHG